MGKDYITPTNENPVFTCTNSYYGYMETGVWKQWRISHPEGGFIGGDTFAMNYADAIRYLLDYIRENGDSLNSNSRFDIEMITGALDKHNDPIRVKVYSLSMKQAKKFKLI